MPINQKNIISKIVGPSLLLRSVGKINSHLFFRGGHQQDICYSHEAFFEMELEKNKSKISFMVEILALKRV